MKAIIHPGKCQGSVNIPPSKSMSHRAIICAALAEGTSVISNIAFSDDIIATIEGMRAIGADITTTNNTVTITGVASIVKPINTTIDAFESGSTLRFLIPILSLSNERITFLGRNRLLHRPQGIYENIFKAQGLGFEQSSSELTIEGSLKPQKYVIDGSISSQFISGLLFTLPLLDGDSEIEIIPPFESESYVNLTTNLLSKFNIKIERLNTHSFFIKGNQKYKACDYRVEGDFSQLGFFAVLASLNNDLVLNDLDPHSLQGDKAIIDILNNCGVNITTNKDNYVIKATKINDCEIDLADCPDLGPILCVLGSYANHLIIKNCARLRLKESDRILAMENALKAIGVDISSDESNIYINGNKEYHGNVEVDGAKDHRIVMSMSVMATLLDAPLTITHAEAINKSYPAFFEDLRKLGIEVELHD